MKGKIKWHENYYKERYKKGSIKINIIMISIIIIISIILIPLSSINIAVPITLVLILIFQNYRWDKKIQINCPLKVGFSNNGLVLNYETQKKRILWEDVKDIEIDNIQYLKFHVIKFKNGSEYPLIYLTNDLISKILNQFKNYKLSKIEFNGALEE